MLADFFVVFSRMFKNANTKIRGSRLIRILIESAFWQVRIKFDTILFFFSLCSPSNNDSLSPLNSPVSTQLVDYNDTHVLDFEPSLRTLCILAVIRYSLNQAEIPQQLRFEIRMMLQANAISRPLTNTG